MGPTMRADRPATPDNLPPPWEARTLTPVVQKDTLESSYQAAERVGLCARTLRDKSRELGLESQRHGAHGPLLLPSSEWDRVVDTVRGSRKRARRQE